MEDFLSCFDRPKKFDQELSNKIREKYLKNELSTSQKMELYNCAVNGNVETLKDLIENKKYNLCEECSAAGYYWTALHYAAHYGYANVVEYILEFFQNHPNKLEILNLQSNLGLSPLFISINNSTSVEKKKAIIELFIRYDAIDYSVCSKEGEDIFDLCKRQNLLDFFISQLKED